MTRSKIIQKRCQLKCECFSRNVASCKNVTRPEFYLFSTTNTRIFFTAWLVLFHESASSSEPCIVGQGKTTNGSYIWKIERRSGRTSSDHCIKCQDGVFLGGLNTVTPLTGLTPSVLTTPAALRVCNGWTSTAAGDCKL